MPRHDEAFVVDRCGSWDILALVDGVISTESNLATRVKSHRLQGFWDRDQKKYGRRAVGFGKVALALRIRAISLLILGTIATSLPPRIAAAAPGVTTSPKSSTASDAKKKTAATKLLAEGNALSNEGDYVEALEKFSAAYDVYPSPKLLLNMGTMLRQLGRNVEAAAVYEQYLKDPDADPQQVELLTRTLDEIDSILAHLRITVSPLDAAVSLDGKPMAVSVTGTDVRVEAGTHKIAAEKKGFPPALVTVVLKRGERHVASLKLELAPVVVKSNSTTIAAIACLSFGGFGFIAAGVTGGLVISANENYQADCPNGKCATVAGYESAKLGTNLLIANGLSWAAGIGGAALGAGLLVWNHKNQKKQSWLVGPGFVGFETRF